MLGILEVASVTGRLLIGSIEETGHTWLKNEELVIPAEFLPHGIQLDVWNVPSNSWDSVERNERKLLILVGLLNEVFAKELVLHLLIVDSVGGF